MNKAKLHRIFQNMEMNPRDRKDLVTELTKSGSGGGVQIVDSIDKLNNLNVPNGSIVSLVKKDYINLTTLYQPALEDFNSSSSEEIFLIKEIEKFSKVENIESLIIDEELLKSAILGLPDNSAYSLNFYDVNSSPQHPISIQIMFGKVLEDDIEQGICMIKGTADSYWGGGDYAYTEQMYGILRNDEFIINNEAIQNVFDFIRQYIPRFDFVFGGVQDAFEASLVDNVSLFNFVKIPKSENAIYQIVEKNTTREVCFKEYAFHSLSFPIIKWFTPQASSNASGKTKIKGCCIYPNEYNIITSRGELYAGILHVNTLGVLDYADVFTIELRGLSGIQFEKDVIWKDGIKLSTLDPSKIYVLSIRNGLVSYSEYYSLDTTE